MSIVQDLRAEHAARRARFEAAAKPLPMVRTLPARSPVAPDALPVITVTARPAPERCKRISADPTSTPRRKGRSRAAEIALWKRQAVKRKSARDLARNAKRKAAMIRDVEERRRADQIMAECAAEFGLTEELIFTGRGNQIKADARHKAAWLIHHNTTWGLAKISRYLRRKNHTSIWYAILAFEQKSPEFCKQWHAENVSQQTLRTDFFSLTP